MKDRWRKARLWMFVAAAGLCASTAGAQPGAAPSATPDAPAASGITDTGEWNDFPVVDAAAPFRDFAAAWPVRWGCKPGGLQGTIIDIPHAAIRPSGDRMPFTLPAAPFEKVPDAAALAQALGVAPTKDAVLESDGAWCVGIPRLPDGQQSPGKLANKAALTFRFVSGRLRGEDRVQVERTWFGYYPPREGVPLKGVVVLMPGMFEMPVGTLDAMSSAMTRRGLGVLRMVAMPPRLVERLRVEIDADHIDAAARTVAAEVDDRQAEAAFAVQAALAHLHESRPETAKAPAALVGASAGAIAVPTVAALDPGAFKATVMIGGGCHYWLMSERSNYREMLDVLTEAWSRPPSEADRAAMRDAFLGASQLDSFNTASALRGTPTLLVMGELDRAVPAPLGHVLAKRVPGSEVWSDPGGHEALFINLPSRFPALCDWLLAKLGASQPAADSVSSQGGRSP